MTGTQPSVNPRDGSFIGCRWNNGLQNQGKVLRRIATLSVGYVDQRWASVAAAAVVVVVITMFGIVDW